VTDSIDSFTEKGIRTKSGEEFEFDVIILATGFSVMVREKLDQRFRDPWLCLFTLDYKKS